MKKKGSELIFISRINKDGLGVTTCKVQPDHDDDEFEINPLSITNGTYIASQFSCYIVKIK